MGRKKTHEEFMKEFYEKNPNAKNIEILGKYEGNNKPIKCRCRIDEYEWYPRPCHLLGNKNAKPTGCPKCSGKAKRTNEEFIKEIYIINPNIKILSEYSGVSNLIDCRCKIDDYEWSSIADNLLHGHGCPKCGGQIKKEHEEFVKEMEEINPNIEILGEYNGVHEYILCGCKICNHEWTTRPHELLNEYGCPSCNISRGEFKIKTLLEKYQKQYKYQYKFKDCKFYNELPFDFYLPDYNIAIEYDGEQHYKIIKQFGGINRLIDSKIRDTVKTEYCKNNNIKLIRIPYWNYKDIENILIKELNLK